MSNPSFDSACVVDSAMQDEVRTNQRQPKIFFCHSCALRYKLPQHKIWVF